jgi:hypothetical protein
MLNMGERFYNQMWFGAFQGNTWGARRSSDGQVWITPNATGVARFNPANRQMELVQRFPQTIGGVTINAPFQAEGNSRGDFWSVSGTSAGDNRIVLSRSGQLQTVLNYSATAATATTLDGRIASGFDSIYLDEESRLWASLRFRNLGYAVLYHYDGQNWIRTAEPTVTRIGNRTINGITNLHRPAGSSFFAAFNVTGGVNILCEWRNGQWQTVVDSTEQMPSGQVMNTIQTFEPNRNGDLLFQNNFNGNTFLNVKRNGRVRQVLNILRPTDDGEYITRINSIDFRDDGTVFILCTSATEDILLYEAKPIGNY